MNVVALDRTRPRDDWERTSALAPWLNDPLVREVMVNDGRQVWIER